MVTTIACVACLDETRSVHTATFKRAVASYRAWHSRYGSSEVELRVYHDNANAEGARKAAAAIVADDVDAVVGHFASAAAEVAAPLYAETGIPLFLPAATASHLTQRASTYRICDNDEDYVAFLRRFCDEQGYALVEIAHDGTLHGHSVTQDLYSTQPRGSQRPAVLFAGSCAHSVAFLRKLGAADLRTVLLTDDAVSPHILAAAAERAGEVLAIGLSPKPSGPVAEWIAERHLEVYGAAPGCYFWETVAAIEVAVASAAQDPMRGSWNSVVGPIQFDAAREARPHAFAVYRAGSDGLVRLMEISK